MSAVVTIQDPGNSFRSAIDVEVPAANGYEIDKDTGYLHLRLGSWSGKVAVFKEWHYVVVAPNRGPDGRFAKKG